MLRTDGKALGASNNWQEQRKRARHESRRQRKRSRSKKRSQESTQSKPKRRTIKKSARRSKVRKGGAGPEDGATVDREDGEDKKAL